MSLECNQKDQILQLHENKREKIRQATELDEIPCQGLTLMPLVV